MIVIRGFGSQKCQQKLSCQSKSNKKQMHLHTVTYTHIHTYSDIYKHIQMDAQYLFDVALPKRLSTNLISACFNSTCWVEQDNGGFLKHYVEPKPVKLRFFYM